jgi:hypothetical protein
MKLLSFFAAVAVAEAIAVVASLRCGCGRSNSNGGLFRLWIGFGGSMSVTSCQLARYHVATNRVPYMYAPEVASYRGTMWQAQTSQYKLGQGHEIVFFLLINKK